MTWWKQPHDLSQFSIHPQEDGTINLMATHYPQPSEPEDFSSGPELVIQGAIHMPSGGEITYEGDMMFVIGRIKHKCESDNADAIYDDPLILRQLSPHEHGWADPK
jgi:hypothetical protein